MKVLNDNDDRNGDDNLGIFIKVNDDTGWLDIHNVR